MATTRTFQDMLTEYLANDLLKEEFLKRDYVLSTIEVDDKWKGGTIPVPFQAAHASSVKFGGLPAANDISENKYVRGKIEAYKEVWGSMIFNYADIIQHDGRVNEDSFLDLLPGVITDFMDYMKMVVSFQMSSGPHFSLGLSDGSAVGVIEVDRVDRFIINQKITLDTTAIVPLTVYVLKIDVNLSSNVFANPGSGTIIVSATRGGAPLDISTVLLADTPKFYYEGVWNGATADSFVNIKQTLLSAANGGSTTLHGQTKTDYPFLQAVNLDGGATGLNINSATILDGIFDAWTIVRTKAKGAGTNTVIMSFKNLGSVIKLIQVEKGPFKVLPGSTKATQYGWTEISILGVTGEVLKFVGVQEWDNDIIVFMNWNTIKFRTNGFFRKAKSPEGLEYFAVRNSTGYQYIIDIALFGEVEFQKPGQCGIIFGIDY